MSSRGAPSSPCSMPCSMPSVNNIIYKKMLSFLFLLLNFKKKKIKKNVFSYLCYLFFCSLYLSFSYLRYHSSHLRFLFFSSLRFLSFSSACKLVSGANSHTYRCAKVTTYDKYLDIKKFVNIFTLSSLNLLQIICNIL